MNATPIVILVLLYCFIRECFFLYTVNRLENKLMSRNYHEFQMSQNVGKIKETTSPLKIDEAMDEDLGHIGTL